MRQNPKWVTPYRQALLARLLCSYLGQVGWKADIATGEVYHPAYDTQIKALIADWVADDRAQSQAEWEAERRELHRLPERGRLRGQFSAIGRDIFFGQQPLYYLEGLGISGLTFQPFAKVRIGSSFVRLHVDLGRWLKPLSKNKRRKAIRYGRISEEVRDRIYAAVRHYLV